MNITQENQATAMQGIRNLHIKVYLLNSNMQIVNQLSGSVISGTTSIDANSDIRRTCNIEMVMEDATFDIEEGQIWLDKYVRIETGIENIATGEIDWINHGIYLINNPVITYSGSESKLSFQGLDLMAKLTGLRNGYLTDLQTQIAQGSSIRNSIISTLALGGFTNYIVEDNPIPTPYQINIDVGGTVFDILRELRDIVPNYEIFFDVNGTFIYQKIPTGANDPILVDDTTWKNVVLSAEKTKEFDKIKNSIYVYGKNIEPNYFETSPTIYDNGTQVLSITLNQITVESDISDYSIIGFISPSTPTLLLEPKISINGWASHNLVNSETYLVDGIPNNEYLCMQKMPSGNYLYLGKQQILATAEDDNPNSPYYIGGAMGEIKFPCIGGEYDNIWSDDLALQRAKYELYIRARMYDSIVMALVPLYYLDVNIKIQHQIASGFDTNQYMIKSVSTDLSASGTQNVQAIRFYPEYPEW